MELSNTKNRILDAALELFSIYGYEATSLGQVAEAVGIKKASLYSHFASKKEIFDTLIDEIVSVYTKKSLYSRTNWNDRSEDHSRFAEMTPMDAVEKVKEQVHFLMHDAYVCKARRIMAIEQYRNVQMAQILEERSFGEILEYHRGLMEYLIEKEILIEEDPVIMAIQYTAPIAEQIYRMDRNPEVEDEAMEIIERHILQFNRMYRKK